MLISEIFTSIQGEGGLAGMPSFFIRLSGCNLHCEWCDTPYASHNPKGTNLSIDEILEKAACSPDHVVITGGEPLIFNDLPELCKGIKKLNKHITIETSGTVYQDLDCDLMSISPKLSNSVPTGEPAGKHNSERINMDALHKFVEQYKNQLKFVVDKPGDISEVEDLLLKLGNIEKDTIFLMPLGITVEEIREKSEWIIKSCLEKGWRYSPRLQIDLFGNRMGT